MLTALLLASSLATAPPSRIPDRGDNSPARVLWLGAFAAGIAAVALPACLALSVLVERAGIGGTTPITDEEMDGAMDAARAGGRGSLSPDVLAPSATR